MTAWYNVGKKTEQDFVKRFGGKHITDRRTQCKGIDVIFNTPDGIVSFDVKDMVRKSGETGNIIYEHTLERSSDGHKISGWGEVGDNTHFAILAKFKNRKYWLCMPRDYLKKFIDEHPYEVKERTINAIAAAKNREIHKDRHDLSHFTIIPLSVFIPWLEASERGKVYKYAN